MDDYGYGAALKGGLMMFEIGGRRSGRTERMLAAVEPGMIVVCATDAAKRLIEHRLRELNKRDVSVIVAPPHLHRIRMHTAGRKAVFDHSWLFEWWSGRLEGATQDLVEFEKMLNRAPERERWG